MSSFYYLARPSEIQGQYIIYEVPADLVNETTPKTLIRAPYAIALSQENAERIVELLNSQFTEEKPATPPHPLSVMADMKGTRVSPPVFPSDLPRDASLE